MKISLDLRLAHLPGGGRVYVQKLIPALIREYPALSWRLYYNPWCPHQREILRQLDIPSQHGRQRHNVELRPVHSPCLSLRQHLEFIRCHDDAALYHYLHFDLPLGMRRIPLVLTIHDLYPVTVPGYCSAIKREYFHRISRGNAKRASRIITISNHTKKDIIRYLDVPEEKIVVVPQSHSPRFHPAGDLEQLESVRRKYHLPCDFIFYTGNHKPHKNLDRLLQAYARLPETLRGNYPLILTGSLSPRAKTLLRKAEALGIGKSVTFIGWVDDEDLPALYNLASLLVQPSLYEGFGLSPLEAMACGTPVACSGATAIPEVIGDVGRVFDPYSIEDMTTALTAALENDVDKKDIARACLRRAEKFSMQKTTRQTLSVYESVTGLQLHQDLESATSNLP